ncbi:MAG: tRNA uracil 4-sulfurtransferase ThiI [Candidatus Izemoplasmatales bacterium]
MKTEGILIRFGDLTIKGKNQKLFVRAINELIKEKLEGLEIEYDFNHDRLYIFFEKEVKEEVKKRLLYVSGLYSFSEIIKVEKDIELIAAKAIELIIQETKELPTLFKVDTKRADKNFPINSMDFSKQISGKILRNCPFLKVDVHHPQLTLDIEIRRESAYIYISETKGMGGFPLPMGGKGLVLLSGGIDSPVASYLSMKKGIHIECIHFESTPLTPMESAQKIIDIASVLARYNLGNSVKILFVPFKDIHEQILLKIPEEYHITIMRRMMLRIATGLLEQRKAKVLITGDSIGQVASQTIESLNTIQNVTDALILRPLTTYDKLDIIKIASEIETLAISNRPFQDCCTVYTPKNPAIHPTIKIAQRYELNFDYQPMIEEAIKKTKILTVRKDLPVNITTKGWVLQEVLE